MCFRNKIVIWWTRRLSTVASLRYLAGECLPPPDVMAKRQSMSVLFTYIYNSFTPSEIFYSSCLWWTQILLLSILVISACFLFCDYQTQSFTAKFLKYSSCQREQLEYTRQEDEANQTAVSRLWSAPAGSTGTEERRKEACDVQPCAFTFQTSGSWMNSGYNGW